MYRVVSATLLSSLAFAGSLVAADLSGSPRTPNIVLILADDLGWGSTGSYGADPKLVRTPHMDRIGAEGMRFTDANAPASWCSPTRYGLLTGRYPWRLTDEFPGHARMPLLIESERLTLASMLRTSGYRTAAIGKWHLGYGSRARVDYTSELRPGPLEIGFDYHFGVPTNHGDRTGIFVENHRVSGLRSRDRMPDVGKNYLGNDYLGVDAPHRVDEEVMEVLTGRAVQWLEDRDERPFFLLFSPVTVHRPVTPSRSVQGSSDAAPFGDWIHEQDRSVGQLLDALARLGSLDDTLLVLTSDNGGVFQPHREYAETLAVERGLEVNGPFRGGKTSIYEGGFRIPLMVRWPGSVRPGSVSADPVSLVDILATVAEIVGHELSHPAATAEDSFSFLSSLTDPGGEARRSHLIGVSYDANYSIRWGPWKWIEGIPHHMRHGTLSERKEEMHPQLYNLRDDPNESRNVIARHSAVATFLERLLDHYRAQGFSRTVSSGAADRSCSARESIRRPPSRSSPALPRPASSPR